MDQLKQGDIEVKVGGKTCNITKIEAETVICIPPNLSQREQDEDTDVTVSPISAAQCNSITPIQTHNYYNNIYC